MRMLYRLRVSNQRWRLYTPMLIRENRWRAMRYSFDEGLIDLGKGGARSPCKSSYSSRGCGLIEQRL